MGKMSDRSKDRQKHDDHHEKDEAKYRLARPCRFVGGLGRGLHQVVDDVFCAHCAHSLARRAA